MRACALIHIQCAKWTWCVENSGYIGSSLPFYLVWNDLFFENCNRLRTLFFLMLRSIPQIGTLHFFKNVKNRFFFFLCHKSFTTLAIKLKFGLFSPRMRFNVWFRFTWNWPYMFAISNFQKKKQENHVQWFFFDTFYTLILYIDFPFFYMLLLQ